MPKKPTYEELEQRVRELEKEAEMRKLAEEALRESEQRFKKAFDHAALGMLLVSPDGRFLKVNSYFCQVLGYTENELLTKVFNDVTHPDDYHIGLEVLRQVVDGTIPFGWAEKRYHHKDGRVVWGMLSTASVRDAVGKPVYLVSHVQDITERKRAEEELKKYRDHLEELVEERTRKLEETNSELESFAYSVSHDLRAPLRAMQGFSQALLEDYAYKLDAEGKEYGQRIVSSAERMETLIQDLLDYSRLSRSEIGLKEVNLDSAVESALTQLDTEINEKDAHISVDKPLLEVIGHSATLEQVMGDLIANAIKFVPSEVKPNIHICAEKRDEDVRLWVEDNGIGIAPEHHERIFRIFERLHGTETYPGTGIGLAIVKRAIEKLGGKVGVESASGKGSRFWIELTKVVKK